MNFELTNMNIVDTVIKILFKKNSSQTMLVFLELSESVPKHKFKYNQLNSCELIYSSFLNLI